jgi:hypothetical protein
MSWFSPTRRLQGRLPISGYARYYYDLSCLADRPEVAAMLVSDEYATIKNDRDQVGTKLFVKSYVPPPAMSFAESDALFPAAGLLEERDWTVAPL